MQSRMRRLQLRGSGGFSPRFPSIAPAVILFTVYGDSVETLPFLCPMEKPGRICDERCAKDRDTSRSTSRELSR
jgi:hypothetical protein